MAAGNSTHNEVITSRTRSLCSVCDRIVDAVIFERGDMVFMRKHCPDHGSEELLYSDDPAFYAKCMASTSTVDRSLDDCDIRGCLTCERHIPHVKTIMLDVTERCNLRCPSCFTNALAREAREPSIPEIVARLEKWKTRPTILICGGEPTLRADLPEIIRTITSMGFVVKVASNGIALQDMAYTARLREAGLDWVLLQYDGPSDDVYRVTRGRPLAAIKEKAIDNLGDAGIKICLAYMVVKGVNDTHAGHVLDRLIDTSHIMHLGCTVLASVGRNDLAGGHYTDALDVLSALDSASQGRLAVADFMHTRRIGSTLFSLTGNLEYQQKSCFHMALLHRTGNGFTPVNRYLSPTGAIRNARGFAQFATLYGKLRHWDSIAMTGHVKLVTVEEFRSHDTIDLVDANRCNKVYMTENAYIPPCIYNTKYRRLCWNPLPVATT